MKIKDIIEISKEYRNKMELIERVHNRVPYLGLGQPDINSKEYKKLVELEKNLDEWLNKEIN